MKNKFTLTEVIEGIFAIREPWHYEGCNIYLFRKGDEGLIFDTGFGLFSLKNFLNDLGIRKITVLLTHSHYDHVGGIGDFSGKEIILHEKIGSNLLNRDLLALDYCNQENFNHNMLKKIFEVGFVDPCREFRMKIPKKTNIAGDFVVWNGYRFELLNLGGHSDDSCVYFERENKLLITGDLLYDGKPYVSMPNSDIPKFKEALNRIDRLDWNLALTGHNSVMRRKEAEQFIDNWRKFLDIDKWP